MKINQGVPGLSQSKKGAQEAQGATPKKRDNTNKCLIVGVVVVSIVAICFYMGWVGISEPSPKPEDWANFATYLSGTVGVAAVVATLFAFVKTLGQQKDLLDSQEKQILLLSYQVEDSKVNLSQLRAVNIFPEIIKNNNSKSHLLLRSIEGVYASNFKIKDSDIKEEVSFDSLKIGALFYDLESVKVIDNLYDVHDRAINEIINYVMKGPKDVVDFCSDMISQDKYLYYYFDSEIIRNKRFIDCYHAYMMGCKMSDEEREKFALIKSDEIFVSSMISTKEDGILSRWYDIGEKSRVKV
ncbi:MULTISPECIES: hypothetical protein [unclassified Halomonas]|uniref:hypothetical protein n=1 Tax=unclassified Halomonas TaxID=2609666 RepID=UPI000F683740|nr:MULTISPECIES: hypothetical protein [unclassified Halomonas]MBT2784804.1 hypothetical protein [Halomonas sp. ISL-106]MBT2796498.1 hypothetical protein [Halomonas sp. ISL-104]